MDWSAVALLIAERARLPALLLGRDGKVLFVAVAAALALGWRSDYVGVCWLERCVAQGAAASARVFLEQALAGALCRFEIEVITGTGPAVARFEARPVGSNGEAGVLLLLEQLTPSLREEAAVDYDYEVQDIAAGNFRVERLRKPGVTSSQAQGKCYEVLHARSTPCAGCALVQADATARDSVRAHSRSSHGYVLTTTSAIGNDGAHVSVRRLSMASLSAMLQARLDDLGAVAGLSHRERAIFGHLMNGRAADEIATLLAIKPRTVKFHQANVLRKLGADSRTDLLRLVLQADGQAAAWPRAHMVLSS